MQKNLTLYDSKLKQKRVFKAQDNNHVKMYVCGPTVYDTPHIGNARPAVVFDVLSRLIRNLYPKLTYVRNITDVDDKIQLAAQKEQVPIETITNRYSKHYHHDMDQLNCLPPDIEPKATQHITTMVELIDKLVARKHAYVSKNHVLFSVSSYQDHGTLSGRTKEGNRAGARIDIADYKREAEDFILWKPSAAEEPGWDSPWGRGRPGWHIECTAMIHQHLGMPIDIHGGGGDLLFPHHENEQAQGCCLGHTDIYSHYWVHNGMVALDKEKMSKSLGNIILVKDLLKESKGEVVRLALLLTHYRQPLLWRDDLLKECESILDKYYRFCEEHKQMINCNNVSWKDTPENVQEALLDDMNTPLAIKHWQALIKSANKAETTAEKDKIYRQIKAVNGLLGIGQVALDDWATPSTSSLTEEEIKNYIVLRNEAREKNDYLKADKIRDHLLSHNVRIIDDKEKKTTWRYDTSK